MNARGNEEFFVTLSSSGQVTVPAPIRKVAQQKGTRRFRVRVVDAEAGVIQLEPVLGFAQVLARYARPFDPPLRDTARELDEEAEIAWQAKSDEMGST